MDVLKSYSYLVAAVDVSIAWGYEESSPFSGKQRASCP